MEARHNMIYIDYVIYHVRDEFYKMVSFITGLKARVFSQRIRKSTAEKKSFLRSEWYNRENNSIKGGVIEHGQGIWLIF